MEESLASFDAWVYETQRDTSGRFVCFPSFDDLTDFVEGLREARLTSIDPEMHGRDAKDGPAIDGPKKYSAKNRGRENILPRAWGIFDIDEITPSLAASLFDVLSQYKCTAWSTHRATPEAPRLRVMFAFNQVPNNIDDWMASSEAFERELCEKVPGLILDPCSKQPQRLMFTTPKGEHITRFNGLPVSVIEAVKEQQPVKVIELGSAVYKTQEAILTKPQADRAIITALNASGLYKHSLGNGDHEILCPFAASHTTGTQGTIFRESGNGYPFNFFCQHAHCKGRTTADYLTAIGFSRADAAEMLSKRERGLYGNSQDRAPWEDSLPEEQTEKKQQGPYKFKNTAEAFFESLEEKRNRPNPISTGLPAIDSLLGGGLSIGSYLLSAPPGVGKTALSLQIADNIAATGRKVIFFSYEMAADEIRDRSIVRMSRARAREEDVLTQKELSELYRFEDVRKEGSRAAPAIHRYLAAVGENLFIIEPETPAIETLESILVDFVAQYEESPIIFIDYLQILGSSDPKIEQSDLTRLRYVTARLREISKKYKTALFIISSVSRGGYYEEPGLESFKNSGDIEFNAVAAMALSFRESGQDAFKAGMKSTPRPLKLTMVKNRRGPIGPTDLDFYPETFFFEDWDIKPYTPVATAIPAKKEKQPERKGGMRSANTR